MKKLNIAIVGLGNIGSYLFKYLNDNKKILTEKNNCIPIITHVSAKNKKRKRNISIKKSQWLNNYLDATKNKNVDLNLYKQGLNLHKIFVRTVKQYKKSRLAKFTMR